MKKSQVTLEILIPQYAANKSELDSYKKLCDKENKRIKELMVEEDITEKEVGGYIAKYTIQRRETINEESLLDIIHLHNIPGVIRTKEYIDYDALESAIYSGNISKEIVLEMDKATEVKEVPVLRVDKIKKEKE